MAGNAHRNRRHQRGSKPCKDGAICKYCDVRPKFGNYRNSNGHRHNPAANKKQ